jgi:hypothetical protein
VPQLQPLSCRSHCSCRPSSRLSLARVLAVASRAQPPPVPRIVSIQAQPDQLTPVARPVVSHRRRRQALRPMPVRLVRTDAQRLRSQHAIAEPLAVPMPVAARCSTASPPLGCGLTRRAPRGQPGVGQLGAARRRADLERPGHRHSVGIGCVVGPARG